MVGGLGRREAEASKEQDGRADFVGLGSLGRRVRVGELSRWLEVVAGCSGPIWASGST
jgi:hypothetical protein